MIRRHQRPIAGFTALLFAVAVMTCACGAAIDPPVTTSATADQHACCTPTDDAPAAPVQTHDGCAHCGGLTVVAPAKAIEPAPAPAIDPFAVTGSNSAIIFQLASLPVQSFASRLASHPNLLRLCCALRL